VIPSGSVIVKLFTITFVVPPIIGAFVTSGIAVLVEAVGRPLLQLPAVAQSVSVFPVHVLKGLKFSVISSIANSS